MTPKQQRFLAQLLIIAFFFVVASMLNGCSSTKPPDTVYGGETKKVNIDRRLLEPPKPLQRLSKGKDLVKQTAHNAEVTADCALRFNELIDVVKEAFNIKDPLAADGAN